MNLLANWLLNPHLLGLINFLNMMTFAVSMLANYLIKLGNIKTKSLQKSKREALFVSTDCAVFVDTLPVLYQFWREISTDNTVFVDSLPVLKQFW